MARKKKTLAMKKVMHKETFDPNNDSKYALKKKSQRGGNFSPESPFSSIDFNSVINEVKYERGINFFKPIDEV